MQVEIEQRLFTRRGLIGLIFPLALFIKKKPKYRVGDIFQIDNIVSIRIKSVNKDLIYWVKVNRARGTATLTESELDEILQYGSIHKPDEKFHRLFSL